MKLLISSNRIGKQYYDNVFVSDEYFFTILKCKAESQS